jgi:hypothetical protein
MLEKLFDLGRMPSEGDVPIVVVRRAGFDLPSDGIGKIPYVVVGDVQDTKLASTPVDRIRPGVAVGLDVADVTARAIGRAPAQDEGLFGTPG